VTHHAVVVDIEGTTSSIASVTRQLFPYARERLSEWIRRDDRQVAAVRAEVRAATGRPGAGPDELAAVLRDWQDGDAKVPALKTLQGLIWAAGFAAGDLVGHVYPDVPPALAAWTAAGHDVHVYSSGSVLAQQLWFRHCGAGDLTGYITGWHDTRTAGPKREPASYHRITAAIGAAPERTTFLSDVATELDAARAVGWRTVLVRRPGEPAGPRGAHRMVHSFAGASLTQAALTRIERAPVAGRSADASLTQAPLGRAEPVPVAERRSA
jgi:enolase-phosphatase E1